jgi:hypothetical protein
MSNESLETVIFKKKTLSDIFEEIHSNSRKNDERIVGLIEQLKDLISTIGDAQQIAPIIASYMKLILDNNEHLIKMAQIAQKCMDKGKETGNFLFSEEDKQQLLLLSEKAEEDLRLPTTQKQLDKIR